ncbi:MAG: hypothetical protein GY841_15005, partial [FCB group bacterium]|nr:hypothetical protein [FCB group bacterium]
MSGTKLLTSLFYIFFIFLGLIIAGCDSPSAPGNETSVFEAEFPANGADKQDINLTVAWTFSDTTAENVSYDLYLGTSFNPPLY